MKTLIAIFGVMIAASVANAQDPCAGMKFCYRYVHPHTTTSCYWVYHCSSNPNSDDFPPDVPEKWPNGATIHYSTNNLSQGCVNAAALDQCIDDAFCMWERLCGSDGQLYSERDAWDPTDINQVPIEIQPTNEQYSASTHEFGETPTDRSRVIAITNVQHNCPAAGATSADLVPANPSNPYNQPLEWATLIDINATSDYAAANTDVYPCPGNDCSTKLPKQNICIALAHEIGHLLGLMHTHPSYSEAHAQPPMPDCGSHDPSGMDLMDTSLNQGCTGNPPNLTAYDKCMYQKLYCPQDSKAHKGGEQPLTTSCDNSSVNDGPFIPAYDPELRAYPNPTTGMLTVQFISNASENVTLRIFNTLGQQMLGFEYWEQPGENSHTVNLSKLPSGHYIVRIASDNIRASRIIVIDR
ncbi:MAG TPA: zinc-dependent metalloprotease [Candidatus Kapabacteria bacterium]|nr:zinc-dependent metalloprotease [Candidatus Kapabacteria bacterium]